MKVSKSLSSVVAAATIVGAVGLAYAQTTGSSTKPVDSSTPAATTPAPDNNMSSTSPSSTTTSTTTSTTSMPSGSTTSSDAPSAELQPKADRN